MNTKTIEFRGVECDSPSDAIQYADAAGGKPITLGGKEYVVKESEADRLEAAGVEFAYIGYCEAIGRFVTVPVN